MGLGGSNVRGTRGQHPRGSIPAQTGLGGLGVRGRESRDPGLSLMGLEGSSFSGLSTAASAHGGPRSIRAEPSRSVQAFLGSGVPDSSMPTPLRNRHGKRPGHETNGYWGAFAQSVDRSGQAGASGVAVEPHQDALTADQRADEFLDSLDVETCGQQDEVAIQSQQEDPLRQERDPQARIRYENVGRRQSKGSRRRQRKAQVRREQKAKELHLPLHEADFQRRGDAGHPRWKNEEAFARDFIDRFGTLDAYPSQEEEELHPSAREESLGGWDEFYREAHKTTFRVQLQRVEKEQRLRDEAELAEALKCEEARKHVQEEAAIRDWLDFWEMP